MLAASMAVLLDQVLHIKSNSQLIIDSVTTCMERRENMGWLGLKNKEVMEALVAHLRQRKRVVIIEKVKAHSEIERNEGADRLANEGAEKENPDHINLKVANGYKVPRTKLASAMQSIIYKSIIEKGRTPYRRSMHINLDIITWAVKENNGELPFG